MILYLYVHIYHEHIMNIYEKTHLSIESLVLMTIRNKYAIMSTNLDVSNFLMVNLLGIIEVEAKSIKVCEHIMKTPEFEQLELISLEHLGVSIRKCVSLYLMRLRSIVVNYDNHNIGTSIVQVNSNYS